MGSGRSGIGNEDCESGRLQAQIAMTANDPIADISVFRQTTRMIGRIIFLLGCFSLSGCVDLNGPIETEAGNLTQTEVDAIIANCGGAPDIVRIEDDLLIVKQSSDLAVTGCVLEALHATGETSLTTVSNQRYETSER